MDAVFDLTRGVYRRMYSGFIGGKRICSVSIGAEAWFWRLHALADDFGNLSGNPKIINVLAGGERDISRAQSEGWIKELADVGLIVVYTVRGSRYIGIVGFESLQPAGKNGRRIRRVPDQSECAAGNPGESGGIQGAPENPGKSCPPRSLPLRDHSEDHSENTNTPPAAVESVPHWSESQLLSAADQVYNAYPRHVGRAAALRAASKAIRVIASRNGGNHPTAFGWLLDRVREYASSPLVATSGRDFIPHPATWLNAGQYDDQAGEWRARGEEPAPTKAAPTLESVARDLGLDLEAKP